MIFTIFRKAQGYLIQMKTGLKKRFQNDYIECLADAVCEKFNIETVALNRIHH